MTKRSKPTQRIPISELANIAARQTGGKDPRTLTRNKITTSSCRVIGIDPGSRVAGYGIVDIAGNTLTHVASGALKVVKKGRSFEDRLVLLFNGIREVIQEHKPDVAAIESIFHHKNAQSALKLGHARGVLLLAARLEGLDIEAYAPTKVKQAAVGYGAADKEQVAKMISLLLGIETPKELDTSDALAVAICHLHAVAPARMFGASTRRR